MDNFNEILDFHNMDELEITKLFNTELYKRMNAELNNEQEEFNIMISELSQDAKLIIADLLERNFNLEVKLEEMQKNMDIAFKYFNNYIENSEKTQEV